MTSATSSAGRLSLPSPVWEPPRSLTTTLAPCAASSSASPRPMPRPAPLTTATFPSSRPIVPPVLQYLTFVSVSSTWGKHGSQSRRGRRTADRAVDGDRRARSGDAVRRGGHRVEPHLPRRRGGPRRRVRRRPGPPDVLLLRRRALGCLPRGPAG